MRRTSLKTLAAAAALALAGARAWAAQGSSFEEVAAQAVPVSDLGMLVSPFVDDCHRSKRDPERARCLAVRAALHRELPGRTFVATREGSELVSVAAYDPRLRGYRLAVAGCLACKQPVEAGAERERRFVTLKPPAHGIGSIQSRVELGRTTVTVSGVAEAESWARTVQPRLRAEVIFQPADEPWVAGASRGYAFRALAVRVYDRCTGTVIYSQPPSQGTAPSEGDQPSCAAGSAGAPSDAAPAAGAGEGLDAAAIGSAVGKARPDFDACIKRFPMPGTAQLEFVVAPSGVPQSVSVEGGAAGTALAQCLSDAGARVRFPAFEGEPRRFKYPLVLRH